MRFTTVIAAAALAAACNKQPPRAATPAPSAQVATAVVNSPAAPAPGTVIRGKVAEKIDASQYSYLKISAAEGETWAAVPKTAKAVGDTVGVVGPVWMENFKSTTLNRTWERIAFGTLEGETAAAPQGADAAPAAPGAGMFAAAAAGKAEKPPAGMTAAPAAAADATPIKVAKASGPQGRTIAELFAGKAQLKDKPVSVRGKVVKATNGVLGKNWLHLRDGTGAGGADDLTIASTDTAKLGDTVLVSGVVHLDRDLGAGYKYDVIVEDAKVKTE